jgi:hypothetical protein
MYVSECVYKIEITAFRCKENYLIKVLRTNQTDKHYSVGPRDSLGGTILKIQQEFEKWREHPKEK